MSRKSLIICLSVLGAMILGIGIAVAFLYSGDVGGQIRKGNLVPDESRYLLLPAVPADAVMVACLSDSDAARYALPSGFPPVLSRMTVSLHYNGSLQALYVFDTGKASSEPSEDAAALMAFAKDGGLCSEYVDCSAVAGGNRDISRRSLVLVSKSETLVKSSLRHLEKSISVMDAAGFAEAASAVHGHDVIFVSNSHAKTLMSGMFSRKYATHHPFVASMSQWTVAEVMKADASGAYMNICPVFGSDPSEYMTVLSKSEPAVSRISQVLPSYTVSAVTLPMKNFESYSTAYQAYMDSKQSLQSFMRNQRELQAGKKIAPEDFFRKLDIREVARASFVTGGRLEEVNLMRIGNEDPVIFSGTDSISFKNYIPALHEWSYASYISSVFGRYFELKDESHFTYMDGWVISGSKNAIKDYVDGKALSYRLVEYMADAGQKDMLSSESCLTVYHSFTEYPAADADMFSRSFSEILKPFHDGCEYCPLVMTMTKGKNGLKMNVQMPKLDMMRTKAPEFVRDTTVVIPEGPFRVKNSGTGKMNLFYQNSHGFLCLQEEGGKSLWGVPFKGKLAGTAYNVDYYTNGKLQILFGSGSGIYVIDRLGRFVTGFPVDLGKEILVGPDLYDFNGTRAYNIMVLHKDNTLEMYNLKGKKPASWKTITAPETIKALPERLEVGGSTFWVVRTAIQTLIYPFGGGTAVTAFKGDEMIRPDSVIETVDGTSVKVECYDGKTRTVKLK